MKERIESRIRETIAVIAPMMPDDFSEIAAQAIFNGMTFGIEIVAEHFREVEINEVNMIAFLLEWQSAAKALQAEMTRERKKRFQNAQEAHQGTESVQDGD